MIRLAKPYQLLLLVLLFTGLSGCNNSDPTPVPGSITGVIRPTGAVRDVQTLSNNRNVSVTPDPVNGAFALNDLPPGTYVLSFSPNPGYRAPANQRFTVKSNQTTDAGTVDAVSDGSFRSGTITWNVNGEARSTTEVLGYADATARTFDLSALTFADQVPAVDRLQIHLGGVFTGIGDYVIGSAGASAVYGRGSSGQPTVSYRSGAANAGTFRVVTYDASAGIMTGTFSLTLPAEAGTGSVGITNGTFSLHF